MAKPPELASAAEFDDRLKRIDEPRWLAARYAPAVDRRRLVALGLLAGEVRRAVGMSEPMLGKIRLQWWRESLEALRTGGPIRRHDLVEELAANLDGRPGLLAGLLCYLDAADAVLDDHLAAGGHAEDADHARRHIVAEAALIQAAGLALAAEVAPFDLKQLEVCVDGWVARIAALPESTRRWSSARAAFAGLPSWLVPAVAHIAAPLPAEGERPFLVRWRIFFAVLTRRLPAR